MSLLDMMEADVFHIVRYASYLQHLQKLLESSKRKKEALTDEERQNLLDTIEHFEVFFGRYEINITRHLNRLRNKLKEPDKVKTPLSSLVLELRNKINDDLAERLFMYIPAERAKYYNEEANFGTEVYLRFPKANREITEAANCYATGNNTACVFHLMRAVELGVRPLVKNLKVSLPRPVELCEWGQIVGGLEDALRKLPKRTTVAASARSEFYSHAVAQFRNFKDAWRNHVAHTRTSYDEHQAMSVMVNAKHFFEHIATRLKE